jgi:hypothetical protein
MQDRWRLSTRTANQGNRFVSALMRGGWIVGNPPVRPNGQRRVRFGLPVTGKNHRNDRSIHGSRPAGDRQFRASSISAKRQLDLGLLNLNQAACHHVDECDEREAGRKGVCSIVEITDHVVPNQSTKLPD